MNLSKHGRSAEGRDSVEETQMLRQAIQALASDQVEFPIKVEGTSTLPYASQVAGLEPDRSTFILKLVRPLPHELASGAPFLMIFPFQDQRFEAEILYLERESYLHYRFALPKAMWPSDRRRHPRFPFRPREAPYVLAQDSGVPGRVIGGPLLNLSQGGALVRVDRVLTLDTGLRIPVRTALFERGLGFSRIRLQDLPRLPLLEVRGAVAHAYERGDEVLLGIAFGDLGEDEARALRESLAFRQAVLSAPGRSRAAEGEAAALLPPTSSGGHALAAAAQDAAPLLPGVPEGEGDPGLALARREIRGLLVAEPGPRRDRILALLRGLGYARLAVLPDLAALAALAGIRGPRPTLLLLDLQPLLTSGEEPLAVFRRLEPQFHAWEDLPTALMCPTVDPALHMIQGPRLRFLDEERSGQWGPVLDGLIGLSVS